MKVLGLSFFYHDSAAALLVDGRPVAMAEEERFSRKKNDSAFPKEAIKFVLKEGNLDPRGLDYVIFYEKPFIKLERIFKNSFATFPTAPFVFKESLKHLFLTKLWVRGLIAKELGVASEKVLFAEHHLSHGASAFFCSPYEKAAVLTVDGVGEWAVTTIGVGEGTKIKILKEIHFPHSLGLLYSAFTAFLGFEVNEGEYKVMGMAPYGKPKYADKVRKMIKFFDDGSYELDLSYFSFHRSLDRSFSRKFTDLFGKPRDPKSKFFTRETGWPSYFGPKPEGEEYERIAVEQEYYADVAASLQAVHEEAVIRLTNEAHRMTGCDNLCLAGGVGLNSVANWKMLSQSPFKNMFVQPTAGDAGGALGSALLVEHQVSNAPRRYVMKHAYFGAEYSDSEIKYFLDGEKISHRHFKDENELISMVVDAITEGKVVGWFNGRFEWGPRALGNRSIIADPRRADMKDIVNTKIKFREPYRPFAPSVLGDKANDFFELPEAESHLPARFMLYVVGVRKEKQKIIPAITHVDGTARPQTVFPEESPRYHKLISEFYKRTGVPLVLNTSFNLKGEPIVNTPADAYSTFKRSEIDVLVLGNYLISK